MSKVTETVEGIIKPALEDMGYELVDVEYAKKGEDMHLTVYVDIPRGVTLDDCEAVSNAIDPLLDEADPTEGKPYMLDVSSPGLDRPFKKLRDYERNYGREVEVKLYAPLMGKKLYEGVLKEKRDNSVVIETEKGETTIEDTRIACVRPLVRFN